MRGRYGRLPSIQALVGFEAAARLSSFSRAAEELAMTQSAISHQIRSLEQQLGQDLFRREGRQVTLTDAGRDLLETARRTLATLKTGLGRLDFYVKPGSVVFSCPPAWARYWLLPRLPDLRSQYPDIDPWIVPSNSAVDVDHSETDCFVTLANSPPPGLLSLELARDCLTPVCAPAYLGRARKKLKIKDMPQQSLLHDEDWEGWNRWFEAAGLDGPAPVSGMNSSDSGLVLDAALAGQGIALASKTIAAGALAKGELLQPFELSIETGLSWYLVADAAHLEGVSERRFWNWILAQAGVMHEEIRSIDPNESV